LDFRGHFPGRWSFVSQPGAATLNGNKIESNTAGNGGGLYVTYSGYGAAPATLSVNTIISNTADWGGGASLVNSDVAFSDNTIVSNTAHSSCGGLSILFGSNVLTGNTISSNIAEDDGGGLCLSVSSARFSDNIVAANTAAGDGGGVHLKDYSDITLVNTVIVDNQADGRGCGLYVSRSSPHLLHSTIARNTGGNGSGIYITSTTLPNSSVILTNTILVSHSVGIAVTGGNTVAVNSILWHNTPITVSWSITSTVTVQNQHEGDPVFTLDGYHLAIGSAAIDKGIDTGISADIDNQPRLRSPDLGADEYWPPGAPRHIHLPLVLRLYVIP
jgi:hypothetical protein